MIVAFLCISCEEEGVSFIQYFHDFVREVNDMFNVELMETDKYF